MAKTISRAALLARIAAYEAVLTKVAGKHAEWVAVLPYLEPSYYLPTAVGFVRKCATIARRVLEEHHPELNAPRPTTKRPARRRTVTTKRARKAMAH